MTRCDVLLVVNCQRDASYGNRGVLAELYGPRFPNLVFSVGPDCPVDPRVPTIVTPWSPTLRDNQCAACPASEPWGRHPAGIHNPHPRLVQVAREMGDHDHILFVEDDCLLAPRVDPGWVRTRLADADALIAYIDFCDRDDRRWVWGRHPTGYEAFDRLSDRFDRRRLLDHHAARTGLPAPPVGYVPLFSGFNDVLAFRAEFLRRIAPDLEALAEVWHEVAVPTILLHHTTRIGPFAGLPLWGPERDRPLDELCGLLAEHDFVHPVKLLGKDPCEVRRLYRGVADVG